MAYRKLTVISFSDKLKLTSITKKMLPNHNPQQFLSHLQTRLQNEPRHRQQEAYQDVMDSYEGIFRESHLNTQYNNWYNAAQNVSQ